MLRNCTKRSKLALLATAGGLTLGSAGAALAGATPAMAVSGEVTVQYNLDVLGIINIPVGQDDHTFNDSNAKDCVDLSGSIRFLANTVDIVNVTTSPASLYSSTDCSGAPLVVDPSGATTGQVAIPSDHHLSLLAG